MRAARSMVSIIGMIGLLWIFTIHSASYNSDAIEKSIISKEASAFVKALGEGDVATLFATVPSSFLVQEVMPNGEVVSYWSSKEWGNELKKTSVNFKNLELFPLNFIVGGSHADIFGKLIRIKGGNSLRGYFWSRLNNTETGWKIVIFKVEWSDSSALERVYMTPGPDFNGEMVNIQKWSRLSFGEDQSDVLKRLGNPDKTIEETSHYKRQGITVEYVTQWDLRVKSLSIQNKSYKTVRGVGVGDPEAFLKERYGAGYDITTWGKSKRKTYSYKEFTGSKWMEFEIVDNKITEISFVDWTQEQKMQR